MEASSRLLGLASSVWISLACVGFLSVIPITMAVAGDGDRPGRADRGPSAAVNAVYAAYSQRLASEQQLANGSEAGDSALAGFAFDIRNYDIRLSQSGTRYFIEFSLKRTAEFQNVVGGGAKYVVRRGDNLIERVEYHK